MFLLLSALLANTPGVIQLSIPPQWATVGDEWVLYWDNCIEIDGAWTYDIDWSISPSPVVGPTESSVGLAWTPTAPGEYTLTVEFSSGGVPVADYTATLNVASNAPLVGSVSVFGDSLSGGNIWQASLAASEPGLSWLGTVGIMNGLQRDSRGGWSWALYIGSYLTDMSPLNCGADAYCRQAGVPDIIVWACGTNDSVGAGTDGARATVISNLDWLMGLWANHKTVRHIIWTPPPGADRDTPFIANYAGTALEDQYYWEQRQRAMSRAVIAHYAGRESERIYVAATATGVDSANDYALTNALHPMTIGYEHISNAVRSVMAGAGM